MAFAIRLLVAGLAVWLCLDSATSRAEFRTMPEWDAAGQCKAMSAEDNVDDDPLYNACLEREQAAYQTLKARLDRIPENS